MKIVASEEEEGIGTSSRKNKKLATTIARKRRN